MPRFLLASLCVGLLANVALCQDPPRGEGQAKPPEPLIKPPSDKPAAAPSPCDCKRGATLKEHQILVVPVQSADTMTKVDLREIKTDAKECLLEVVYEEQERKVKVLEMEPTVVEQKVTCTRMEEKEVIDPCTGCKRKTWCEVPYVETVSVTQMKCVEKEKTIVVRVPCLKTVQKDIVLRRLAVDVTKIPAIATRYKICELKQEIPVPSCPPSCPPTTIIPGPSPCGCKK